MNVQDVHPADDHSHKFFIWHEWIQAHGPLTAENVLDYFATSMFYDKQSNNQVLRMQTVHTGVALKNEAEELKRFTGIEFALVTAQPPTLFVIHKQHRYSPDAVQPLVAYFILHNRIYQAPDVYSVVSNRMLASLHSLQASLETIRAHRPDFTPRLGFVWPIVEGNAPSAAQGTAAAADSPRKARPSVEPPEASALQRSDDPAAPQPSAPEATPAARAKKATDSRPLYLAMTTTALHAKATLVPRFRDNNSGPATEPPPPPAAVPDQPAPPSASPAPLARAGSTDGAPSKKKRKRTGTAAPQTTTS